MPLPKHDFEGIQSRHPTMSLRYSSSQINKYTRKGIGLTGSYSLEELNQPETFGLQKGIPHRGMSRCTYIF